MTVRRSGWARSMSVSPMVSGSGCTRSGLSRAAVIALLDEQDRVLLLWRHRFVPGR